MKKELFHIGEFNLELGGRLQGLNLVYHSSNVKQPRKVVWIFHALTGSSNPYHWWNDLLKQASWIDPALDLIICANLLGSCYGTNWSKAEENEEETLLPFITVRDNVNAFCLLANHLGVEKIDIGIGGSLGGSQLLEWNIIDPFLFDKIILIACGAKESTWAKAAHYIQRRALENDQYFKAGDFENAHEGLKTARSVGMLTYRSHDCYEKFQADCHQTVRDFKVESYLKHQENKFIERFNPLSYYLLSQTLDTHSIARDRGTSFAIVLNQILAKSLIIGIESDMLCPIQDQLFMHKHIKNSTFECIESVYGHDGFLVESQKINEIITTFLN